MHLREKEMEKKRLSGGFGGPEKGKMCQKKKKKSCFSSKRLLVKLQFFQRRKNIHMLTFFFT